MNQILSTTNKVNKKPPVIDIKKIVIFFCVVIIIFGLGLALFKIYQIYTENKEISEAIKPEILVNQDGDKITITAKHQEGIEKVEYYWDKNDIKVIEGNEKKKIEKTISLIPGDNTLTVKVTDIKGNETKSTNKFSYNTDAEEPKIELGQADVNGKISIVVTDETKLDYITYKFEGEAEQKIFATEESPTKIETSVTIKRGQNNLIVEAVDSNKNVSTITQPYVGVLNPVIDVYQQGDTIYITITHDKGFEKVEFKINDNIYNYDKNSNGYSKDKTKLEYNVKLKTGENKIEITANSLEPSQTIGKYKAVYNP